MFIMSGIDLALDDLRRSTERLSLDIQNAKTKDAALTAAIKAADASMQAMKLAVDPGQKTLYVSQAKRFIQKAEDIKQNSQWKPAAATQLNKSKAQLGTASALKVLKEPANTRALTTREQIILARATWLNGVKFPMWEKAPSIEEFEVGSGEGLFLCVSSKRMHGSRALTFMAIKR